MQIALEKEFQAKEQLIDENQQLRADLDSKAHKIADLLSQIEKLQRDSSQYQNEIQELNSKLVSTTNNFANVTASTPIVNVPSASSTTMDQLDCQVATVNNHNISTTGVCVFFKLIISVIILDRSAGQDYLVRLWERYI